MTHLLAILSSPQQVTVTGKPQRQCKTAIMGHAKGPSNRFAQRAEQHAPIHRTLSLDIDAARKELLNAAQGKSHTGSAARSMRLSCC